eukprot:CAMPEP_0119076574 /NCGR_PEP_ID=MMETSP1178-20130426/88091_1 /TAXON_ID=33656 /ORGANISM="unid sp, Strain CCMP2000" /LENGTH=90 /DNA_ID=CAMNT_0007058869 /DNA_START=179 /DNA_END=448 /DNA_ORIENTATION=+
MAAGVPVLVRWLRAPCVLVLRAKLLQHEGGGALANHHARGVSVAAGREGHHRCIGDAQSAHTMHTKPQINDALANRGRESAGAGKVVDGK